MTIPDFRPKYRELSDNEKQSLNDLKNSAMEFAELIEAADRAAIHPAQKRCYALAKTKLEESVMWAVKGFTQ